MPSAVGGRESERETKEAEECDSAFDEHHVAELGGTVFGKAGVGHAGLGHGKVGCEIHARGSK